MLLQELIKKRVKVIENKNTDTNTNSAKKRAWIEVEESFNSLRMGGQRNIDQLRTQWVATKVSARKRMATHRKLLFKTGGGTQPSEMNISGDDISVWLPNEFMVDTNEFDSDACIEILEEPEGSNGSRHANQEDDSISNKNVATPKEQLLENSENPAVSNSLRVPDTVPAEEKCNSKSASKKKEKTQKGKPNSTDDNITKLTNFDIDCKRELHELQIDVERKRIRNLNRELDLIEQQIKYYKTKSGDK